MTKRAFHFLFLALLLSPGLAAALDVLTLEQRREMCAEPSSASKEATLEAQAFCPECLAKGTGSGALKNIQTQAKDVELQAQKKRDLQLFRDFKSSFPSGGTVTLEDLKATLEESEFWHKYYKTTRFTGDGAKSLDEFAGAVYELKKRADLNSWTSEEREAYLQKSENLRNLIQEKIQACAEGSKEYQEKEDRKSEFNARAHKYKYWSADLEKLEKDIQNAKPYSIPYRMEQVTSDLLSMKMTDSQIKYVESVVANNQKKVQDKEKELAAKEGENPETVELKNYESSVAVNVLAKLEIEEGLCGMTTAEIWTIYNYTTSNYREINTALRADPVLPKYQNYRDIFNSALAKIKKFSGEVKRGASLPPQIFAQHQVGAVVTYPAFTSTSTAKAWSGAQQFVIKSKAGHYVEPISAHRGENEVIFPAGSKFKVLSIEPTAKIFPDDSPATVEEKNKRVNIIMEELDGDSP